MFHSILTLTLMTAGPAANPARLDALVRALGAQEKRRASSACRYIERTALEELDDEGKSKGKVIREYQVTPSAAGSDRVKKSEEVVGDPSSLFRREHKSDEKPHPGPFHPEEQKAYRYELLVPAEATVGTLRFWPIEPHEKRMKGTARVDLAAQTVTSMQLEPSDPPTGLDELKMRVEFGDTACGRQPVRVTTAGSGGILFFEVRFRSVTSLSRHSPLEK
jgi:hypothetical protein